MPVLSCGGMRYQQSWTAGDPVDADNQRNLETTVRRALELGINHIETARGYGTSEEQLGQILPSLPRDQIIVQTKIAPTADPDEFERDVHDSMARLRIDHVDLLALHGVNDAETLDWSLRAGGCLERARSLVERGVARYVGFSTHGSVALVKRAVLDGRFDYVNLHYYFVYQLNRAAIDAAVRNDMGVFIISPNDKGGKLYEPPESLVKLVAPLHPMAFNDLWCLTRKGVHTLSIGASMPTNFDVHVEAVDALGSTASAQQVSEIEQRLRGAVDAEFGDGWFDTWHEGIPEHSAVPGGVNVLEIVRLYTFAKALGLIEYGKMRYNLLGSGGHWFPGNVSECVEGVEHALRDSPHCERIVSILGDAHSLLSGEKRSRMQND